MICNDNLMGGFFPLFTPITGYNLKPINAVDKSLTTREDFP